MTSRFQPDSSAHLDKPSKQHNMCSNSNCAHTKRLIVVFKNSTGACFVYITVVLGQSLGLSKEMCRHADADWQKLICQSEGGERTVISYAWQRETISLRRLKKKKSSFSKVDTKPTGYFKTKIIIYF